MTQEPNNEQLIPHFLPNISINVDLNISHIQGIQAIYSTLLEGKTQDDANALKQRIDSKAQLSTWDMAIIAATNLLRLTQEAAVSSKQVEYKPLSDVVMGMAGS